MFIFGRWRICMKKGGDPAFLPADCLYYTVTLFILHCYVVYITLLHCLYYTVTLLILHCYIVYITLLHCLYYTVTLFILHCYIVYITLLHCLYYTVTLFILHCYIVISDVLFLFTSFRFYICLLPPVILVEKIDQNIHICLTHCGEIYVMSEVKQVVFNNDQNHLLSYSLF